MSRLLVVTARELTRDVRARRQVEAALDAGLDVVGLSATQGGETPLPLRDVLVVRFTADRLSGELRKVGLGGLRRSAAPVRELRGVWRFVRLLKTTTGLVRAGRRLGSFDIVHTNDLDALPAGYLIARRCGARLIYDAHELYRYMEADPPRLYTALASVCEGWLGRRAKVVTNCELFANELQKLLRLAQRPAVVLNCPDPVPDLPAGSVGGDRIRVIYQAAADSEGRPVADLLEGARHAPEVDVTIRLVQLDRPALEAAIRSLGLSDRVRLADPVDADRLVEGLFGFDVGVIINRDDTPNSSLSVPGKLWEYMMAGLATVAPASPGLALVDDLGVGSTFAAGNPLELAGRLREVAADRDELARMKERSRDLALARFNSSVQAGVLRDVWGLAAP